MPTSPDPLSTSTSLLNHVCNGEQVAWQQLVENYTPMIETWCKRYGIQGADAEDITQDVFMTVSLHIGRFDIHGDDRSFRGWLWTITRSRVVDQIRRSRSEKAEVYGVDMANVGDRVVDADRTSETSRVDLRVAKMSIAIVAIRADFSEQTWAAFWCTAVQGRAPSEVARELNMTAAAVCMSRVRVLKRLRETIGE